MDRAQEDRMTTRRLFATLAFTAALAAGCNGPSPTEAAAPSPFEPPRDTAGFIPAWPLTGM
jgi:hypothetical protein